MNSSVFNHLLVYRFFAAFADQLMLFAVPVIIYMQTKSVVMSGIAFFIEWTPRILSLPLAGSLSDRFGSKSVYLFADAMRAVACVLVFIAIVHFNLDYFVALSLFMASSAFLYAQSYISLEALIPKLADKASLPKLQSRLQAIEQGSMISAPVVGALIIANAEPINIVIIAGILYFSAFIGISLIHIPEAKMSVRKNNKKVIVGILRDFRKAWQIFRIRENLLFLTILSISINLVFGIGLATGAALTTGHFSRTASDFGLLQSITGLLMLLSLLAVPMMLKRVNLFSLGIVSYIVVAVCAFIIGVSNNFYVYAFCYACIFALGSWFNIYIRSERALWIPKVHLGKTIGMIVFLNQLTLPVSGLIVGLSSSEEQVKNVFLALSLITVIVLIVFFHRLRSTSRVVAPSPVAAVKS